VPSVRKGLSAPLAAVPGPPRQPTDRPTVIVLLALLYLGVKDIHLGPTLPGFLSPNVVKVLADNFGIAGITGVDDDVRMFMAS
jgi:hydroxylamine reductase